MLTLDDNSLSLQMHGTVTEYSTHCSHTFSRINKQPRRTVSKGEYTASDNQPFNKQLHGNLF